MAKSDFSPLKVIFSRVINRLMYELLKILRYLFASAYKIFNIPTPFLSLLLCAAHTMPILTNLQVSTGKYKAQLFYYSQT